jgi:hypothetical protein
MTRRLQLLFFMILLFPLLTGCRKEDPNPEMLDPIYSDLSKRQKDAEGTLEEEKKKLAKAQEDMAAALPNTIDLQNAIRDRDHSQHAIDEIQQKIHYLTIRTERRRVEDKYNYHLAFQANKDWPDKREYDEYLTNQRLEEAPRNWDAHIPKLSDRKPAAATPPPKKEGGEE